MIVLPVSSPFHRRALRAAAFPRAVAGWPDACDPADRSAPLTRQAEGASVPPLDVAETGAAYIATLDMPGIAREQLEVSVEGRRVVISTAAAGTKGADAQPADGAASDAPRALHRERATPRYARSFMLPAELDAAAAQARLDHGVLTLTLPKRVATGAARVTVQ